MIVRSRIAGRLFLNPIVPWTEKSIVVVSERRLAAVIASRRDPDPESFRLDTVTEASPCAVDATAAEPDTAITAPAASRALNSLRIQIPSRRGRQPSLPLQRCQATSPPGGVSILRSATPGRRST